MDVIVPTVTLPAANVPVVVRLEGTNADIAKDILSNSGVKIIPANDFKDAAIKSVNAAMGKI